LVPGDSTKQTQDEYHMLVLQDLITSQEQMRTPIALQSSRGGRGDETADLIMKLIGVNALNADETRNVLAIIRDAYEKPESIAPTARFPGRTYQLLRHLADFTDQESLRRQIGETLAYVQTR
jgi:hypothetical protein